MTRGVAKRKGDEMITARGIPEYRKCDLPSCTALARLEFARTDENGQALRVFVCEAHEVEGFIRVREAGRTVLHAEAQSRGEGKAEEACLTQSRRVGTTSVAQHREAPPRRRTDYHSGTKTQKRAQTGKSKDGKEGQRETKTS